MPSRRALGTVLAIGLIAGLAPGGAGGGPGASAVSAADPAPSSLEPRQAAPEDRYALSRGCYAVRSRAGGPGDYVVRDGDGGFGLGAAQAEPFFFQATDLGSYLIYGTERDFLAASDGVVGTAADAAQNSTAGGYASGLTTGATDDLADTLSNSEANTATGRGATVVAAAEPSELADWKIGQVAGDDFMITLPATGQILVADAGELGLAPDNGATEEAKFGFELLDDADCATYPEIEVNVDGGPFAGDTSFEEVQGYIDLHLHMMAFEFIGGRVRCGRPWHRYGAPFALKDCPDHEPGGFGAALEQVLSGPGPHTTDGWPTFGGWPRPESLTHEQAYYKWVERAWRGGLRLFVNLFVDNRQLCQVYPYKSHGCNEMDGVRLQHQRILELQDYIDAQNGGPGEGWFRIVYDPFAAREVINQGKLAVVLGIEVSVPLDCGLILDEPQCDEDDIDERLDEVYDELGVRQMLTVNKFDNALTGVTGDSGDTGVVVNQGNLGETGRYWQMETCDPEDDAGSHDKTQHNVLDRVPNGPHEELPAAILQMTGRSGAAPLYPPAPHCNLRRLSDLGRHMLDGMIERGMLFDPDHMSARARRDALDHMEAAGYPGVVSSHSWADDVIYAGIHAIGGVVTPSGGRATPSFYGEWKKNRAWADPRFEFGFGYGSDVNGFASQAPPRNPGPATRVNYPFSGLGGVAIDQQRSGTRVYDINTDGVSHYGLYPDWIEDLGKVAENAKSGDGAAIKADMARGAEAYLQMWERAVGVPGSACRADVEDLDASDFDGLTGKTPEQVLRALGQPDARTDDAFTYCLGATNSATVVFDANGVVDHVDVSA